MRRVFAVLALGLILGLSGRAAMALSFGRIANASLLGQPLDFSASLVLDPGESISADCVGAEVLAGEVRVPASKVRILLDGPPRGPRVNLRVRTTQRIVEPVVTVRLTAGCTARQSRSFVTFLEPALRPRERTVPDATALAAPVADPPPRPALDAEAAASAAAAQRREAERALALEDSLNRARVENAAARQAVSDLQARLRESEATRRNPPLVYGLATLVALLGVAIVVLLMRLARARAALDLSRAGDSKSPPPPHLDVVLKESALDHTWTQMRAMTEPVSQPFPADDAPHPITIAPPAAARPQAQELSADELIDLEQQADFFVALSQDEAAIDLLMGHLRSSGGASPMPYLKLLEIYRRRADTDAHERIRERFNRRFNAHAPALAADPTTGRSLDGYPEILPRVLAAWPSPAQAIRLLESLMFRVDDADPGVDLTAFRDLLLLYSVARDRLESEASADGVDLLLPLGAEASVISASPSPVVAAELDVQLP